MKTTLQRSLKQKMKIRLCNNCRKKVATQDALMSQLKAFCCYECLKSYSSKNAEKIIAKERRVQDRKTKEKLKTRGDWMKEAQAAVNAYIRWRDRDKGCISCGTSLIQESTGGGYDAGHYLSRGAHPNKRFRLDNIFGQCKRCNRYMSGNVSNMRIGIIQRHSQEFLDRIETCQHNPRIDIDYLKRIKKIFTKRLKALNLD